ncbi:MAG: ribonuclease HII [bacterium]|nr:ribonuclease HII [Candidatus Margulisiibacteriota bacterium]
MARKIAGVDEAGRGPLAGPIVAAAVILPAKFSLPGLDDSKKLSPQKRDQLFVLIYQQALAVGVGRVSHKKIDQINIGRANILVMERAVQALSLRPDLVLIDGRIKLKNILIMQKSIVRGDQKFASIAAASIIAKVTRDRIMLRYHQKYPLYNFAKHKGYGTREHLTNLEKHGPCEIHRRSFTLPSSCR